MDSAGRSVEEVQLEGYFIAALAFIDPQLSAECDLAEVEAAATRRQQSLASLPPQLGEGDLQQLSEALEFVRRYHARLQVAEADATTASADPDGAENPVETGGYVASEAALEDDAEFEVGYLAPPDNAHADGNGNGNGNGHASGNGARLWEAVTQESNPPTAAVIAPVEEPAAFVRGRSPLRKLWEDAECEAQGECPLPEQQALPVARGLLLLAFEAWLAGFAGWVATRFMAWPREGVGYDVTPVFGHVMVLIGFATFGVAGWLIWRYRAATRRISALVHAAGVLLLLDLVAWRAAAAPENGPPMIDAPGVPHWELLVAGWLIAGIAAYFVDLRAK